MRHDEIEAAIDRARALRGAAIRRAAEGMLIFSTSFVAAKINTLASLWPRRRKIDRAARRHFGRPGPARGGE